MYREIIWYIDTNSGRKTMRMVSVKINAVLKKHLYGQDILEYIFSSHKQKIKLRSDVFKDKNIIS